VPIVRGVYGYSKKQIFVKEGAMKSLHVTGKAVFSLSVLSGALFIGALFTAGCASYREVKEIGNLPAERSATIRVEVNTTSQGKILQEEIEKGVLSLGGGTSMPRPVRKHEWYLWLGIDEVLYPLIPRGRTFVTNTFLIHEGDAANLAREYTIPAGAHRYLLGFAGLQPFVYTKGFGGGEEDGEDSAETRLGLTWKQCFKAQLKAGEVLTVRIDDTGIHLPEGIQAEPLSNCNQWLFGPVVKIVEKRKSG
jgi:hypothetical protein